KSAGHFFTYNLLLLLSQAHGCCVGCAFRCLRFGRTTVWATVQKMNAIVSGLRRCSSHTTRVDGDTHLLKCVAVAFCRFGQGFGAAGVGELVGVNDMPIGFAGEQANAGGAYEAGAAGDQKRCVVGCGHGLVMGRSTVRCEWSLLSFRPSGASGEISMPGGTAKKDLSIPVAGSLQSR